MSKCRGWQEKHGRVILSFLKYLNGETGDYILKGGTALSACYGLDRFSEDIDLDGRDHSVERFISDFCGKEGFSYRVAKDTDTVKRYMINYGNEGRPLKVEVSFRKKDVLEDEITKIRGFAVYRIESLCSMKTAAYAGRDKIRDLYDLAFICSRYWDSIPEAVRAVVRDAVGYKGIEHFDYIIKEQHDELINTDKLAGAFLEMHDRLGLLYDEDEKKLVEEISGKALKKKQNGFDITI